LLQQPLDGFRNRLGMILGDEVLAALYTFHGSTKLVGEPVSVADLLEPVGRSPHQACRHVKIRDPAGNGKSILHFQGAGLPDHRAAPPALS